MFTMFTDTSDGGHSGDRRGGHFDRSTGGGGRLPAGGQQGSEVVLIGHGRKPHEDVGEVKLGIMAVALGAFHQGVNEARCQSLEFSVNLC